MVSLPRFTSRLLLSMLFLFLPVARLFAVEHLEDLPGTVILAQSQAAGYEAVKAIDDSLATEWLSVLSGLPLGSPSWLELQWSAPVSIGSVLLSHSPFYPLRDFTIETWNGEAWVVHDRVTDNLGSSTAHTQNLMSDGNFPDSTTRLRVNIQAGNVYNYPRLPEITVLPIPEQGDGAPLPPETLWPMFRYDPARTGRYPLPGSMPGVPTVKWRYQYGPEPGPIAHHNVDADPALESIHYSAGGVLVCKKADGSVVWESEPIGASVGFLGARDMDAHGDLELLFSYKTSNALETGFALLRPADGMTLWRHTYPPVYGYDYKIGDIDPTRPGLEILFWCHTEGVQGIGEGVYTVFDQGAGNAETLWHQVYNDYMYFPQPIAGDVDLDGKNECIVLTHSKIRAYHLDSGLEKWSLRWDWVRSYGAFLQRNLDSDPYPEYIVLSDTSRRVEVIDNTGAGFELLWEAILEYPRDIQPSLMKNTLRYGFTSVADLDGNGRMEVVVNLLEESVDQRWHTLVLDELDGSRVLDLPDTYCHGAADLNGDGRAELFLAAAPNGSDALPAALTVGNWSRSGGFAPLWQSPTPQRYVTLLHDFANDMQNNSIGGTIADVQIFNQAGKSYFKTDAGNWFWEDGAIVGGGKGDPSVAEPKGFALTQYYADKHSPIVADLNADGIAEVLVQDLTQTFQVVRPPAAAGAAPQQIGSLARGGNVHFWGSWPHFADLDGDGAVEHFRITRRADGGETFHVIDSRNQTVWSREFPPATGSQASQAGIVSYNTGRFNNDPCLDVFVSWYGDAAGEYSLALSGADGSQLWRLDLLAGQTYQKASTFASGFTAVRDVNRDGYDDIAILAHGVSMGIVNGNTKQTLAMKETTGTNQNDAGHYLYPGKWAVGASPRLVEETPGGALKLLMDDSQDGFGVSDMTLKEDWSIAVGVPYQLRLHFGVGDVDGDGRKEVGIPYSDGLFRCHDLATGEVKWTYDIGSSCSDVITADVDGHGRDEFLFGTGDGRLIALGGEGDAPRLLWSRQFSQEVGSPIMADLDQDGDGEILVTVKDGFLYVLDAADSAAGGHWSLHR